MGAVREGETRNHGGEVVSAVEAIFELREITWNMLGTYGSIGSNQSRLDVAQRRVDPVEGGRFGGSRACAGLDRGVRASDVGDGRETRKTVGQHLGVGGERRSGEFADRDKAERFDRPQDDLIRFSVFGCGDRRHERRLALGPPSAPARTSAADVGVVHLDGAFQSLARVALEHDLRELVFRHPSRGLGDAEPATQFDAGDAFLGLRNEKDSLEPDAQRQLAGGEYGSSLDGGLLAAGVAWNKRRAPRFTRQWPRPRQSGHSNPSGQRIERGPRGIAPRFRTFRRNQHR